MISLQIWHIPAAVLLIALLGFWAGYKVKTLFIKNKINNLSLVLDKIMRGLPADGLFACKEGDFGRLYNQLETVVSRTDFLVARLESEKSNIKDYIADISHELKTPVTALITYLEVLRYKETDESAIRQLERCIALAEKTGAITKCLLDLARLETNDLIFTIESCVLTDTIDYVFELVMQCGINNNLTMVNKVEKNIVVRADKQWMSQAIFNILKNAAAYCGEHPRIWVTAVQTDAIVLLKIKDNGPGLRDEDAAHIFDRFYRVDKNKTNGLGLGLSIAKMIVEKHHGSIDLHSNETGTEFSITIPVLNTVTKTKV